MTKSEIRNKRNRDNYYKEREREFRTVERMAKNLREIKEFKDNYDRKHRYSNNWEYQY